MKKLMPLALLPFMGSCCRREPEPLYVPELQDEYLTTDDTEALAKYGIYYDMDRNKRSCQR